MAAKRTDARIVGAGDEPSGERGHGGRAGGPAGGAGLPAGAIAWLGVLMLLAGAALLAWRVCDPPRRFADICYSLDQAVDLPTRPAG